MANRDTMKRVTTTTTFKLFGTDIEDALLQFLVTQGYDVPYDAEWTIHAQNSPLGIELTATEVNDE